MRAVTCTILNIHALDSQNGKTMGAISAWGSITLINPQVVYYKWTLITLRNKGIIQLNCNSKQNIQALDVQLQATCTNIRVQTGFTVWWSPQLDINVDSEGGRIKALEVYFQIISSAFF